MELLCSSGEDEPGEINSPLATPARRPKCQYGSSCYRKNPEHKREYCHPRDNDWSADGSDGGNSEALRNPTIEPGKADPVKDCAQELPPSTDPAQTQETQAARTEPEINTRPAKRPKTVAPTKLGKEKQDHLIVLMIDESDAQFQDFIASCKENCESDVQNHCFQAPGTFHFTLRGPNKQFTETQALEILSKAGGPAQSLSLSLSDFKLWPTCLALSVDEDSCAQLDTILQNLDICLPKGEILQGKSLHSQLHLSLYRGRNFRDKAHYKAEFKAVRQACSGLPKGRVRCKSIAVKKLGAPYTNMRTIATFS
jgi:hypothetical protein